MNRNKGTSRPNSSKLALSMRHLVSAWKKRKLKVKVYSLHLSQPVTNHSYFAHTSPSNPLRKASNSSLLPSKSVFRTICAKTSFLKQTSLIGSLWLGMTCTGQRPRPIGSQSKDSTSWREKRTFLIRMSHLGIVWWRTASKRYRRTLHLPRWSQSHMRIQVWTLGSSGRRKSTWSGHSSRMSRPRSEKKRCKPSSHPLTCSQVICPRTWASSKVHKYPKQPG